MMHDNFIKGELAIEEALLKQKVKISEDDDMMTLREAYMRKDFLQTILDTSLQNEDPKLYQAAMADYLTISQAIEIHLVTNDLQGKIKKNAKSKTTRTTPDIPHDSEES
jgi:hypothetical protein